MGLIGAVFPGAESSEESHLPGAGMKADPLTAFISGDRQCQDFAILVK